MKYLALLLLLSGCQGLNGKNGTACTTTTMPPQPSAPNGGSMISCTDGSSSLILNGIAGIQGPAGGQGPAGDQGATGPEGPAGMPGTIVQPIQFCSGTPIYPSTFPEVGFCINNQLWAVYSANGGFLTLIPPGQYSSTGINSSCTFTVGPDCVISY